MISLRYPVYGTIDHVSDWCKIFCAEESFQINECFIFRKGNSVGCEVVGIQLRQYLVDHGIKLVSSKFYVIDMRQLSDALKLLYKYDGYIEIDFHSVTIV